MIIWMIFAFKKVNHGWKRITTEYYGKKMMVPILNSIRDKMVAAFQVADEVMRGKAIGKIEYEAGELDNIFAIQVLGAFIGIPAPPIHITMALMPEMEKEFEIMLEKVSTAHDPLGELFSVLDID